MRYFYYVELFFLVVLVSWTIQLSPMMAPLITLLGCLYILYIASQFLDVKEGDIIYRPCSILYEAYGDPDGRTYYEVLEKHKTSAIVKNKHNGSIRKLYLTEYIIFLYKILNKPAI